MKAIPDKEQVRIFINLVRNDRAIADLQKAKTDALSRTFPSYRVTASGVYSCLPLEVKTLLARYDAIINERIEAIAAHLGLPPEAYQPKTK